MSRVLVGPAVLEQALGSLDAEAGERIEAAAFVASATGPHLRCGKDASTSAQLIALTDRRLVKAVAWWPGEDLGEGVGAMWDWIAGSPITRGYFTRRLIWLGEIREVRVRPGVWPVADALVLHTHVGRETIKGRSEVIRLLDEALYDVRRGPHGRALPPPAAAQPALAGGWATRIAAILRPN